MLKCSSGKQDNRFVQTEPQQNILICILKYSHIVDLVLFGHLGIVEICQLHLAVLNYIMSL